MKTIMLVVGAYLTLAFALVGFCWMATSIGHSHGYESAPTTNAETNPEEACRNELYRIAAETAALEKEKLQLTRYIRANQGESVDFSAAVGNWIAGPNNADCIESCKTLFKAGPNWGETKCKLKCVEKHQ